MPSGSGGFQHSTQASITLATLATPAKIKKEMDRNRRDQLHTANVCLAPAAKTSKVYLARGRPKRYAAWRRPFRRRSGRGKVILLRLSFSPLFTELTAGAPPDAHLSLQGDLWGDMQPSGPRGSARGTYCAPEALGANLVDPA